MSMLPLVPETTFFPYTTLFRSVVHEEQDEAYVDVRDDFRWVYGGDKFFWTSDTAFAREGGTRYRQCGTVEWDTRSEEHTSELQSPVHLVCRLLLEKKNRQSSSDYKLVRCQCYRWYRRLRSFPTRRSSDLSCTRSRTRRTSTCATTSAGCTAATSSSGPATPRSHAREGRGTASAERSSGTRDRKSTRLNSSHPSISYAVFCLKKKIDRAVAIINSLDVNVTAGTGDYVLSLHDALPICRARGAGRGVRRRARRLPLGVRRRQVLLDQRHRVRTRGRDAVPPVRNGRVGHEIGRAHV